VTLRSGGTVTASASINLFKLPAEDREFVFGLIDEIHEYEEGTAELESSE